MRTSSLDVSSPTYATAPKLTLNLTTLLSSPSPSRPALLTEIDSLIRYTKWSKLRWDIEMRRNILLQQGAKGLAGMVDVEEGVGFVARVLGEERHFFGGGRGGGGGGEGRGGRGEWFEGG